MKKIRIILIEDNRLLREGISATLKTQADFALLGASDGTHATAQVLKAKPDVVLMDLGLRHQNGFRLVASLRKTHPDIKMIGLGLIATQADIIELVEAGAAGFVLKDASVTDFFKTIRTVAGGGKVLPPLLTNSLFTHVIDSALRKGRNRLPGAVRMTKREREIIAAIAEGLSNKEIASRLNIATHTVKSHVHNIMEKLALHSRLQIAAHTYDDPDNGTHIPQNGSAIKG